MEKWYNEKQLNFFDVFERDDNLVQAQNFKTQQISSTKIENNAFIFEKYHKYDFEKYKQDVINVGLKETWLNLNHYILNYNIDNQNKFLSIENFAELYEIGLALENKENKKNNGQYYTPEDVASVMANWFKDLKGENICDVGCGTGKLILTYLDIIGKENAINLIKNGKLFLYDLDETALSICKTILLVKYGKELSQYIHAIHCDFLSKNVSLPLNCKVISNPPYSNVKTISKDWDKTIVAVKTKELYAMFIEKIIKQSESSVIISPYSFMGGNKFYSLRELMNNYNGFIVSFDNVPGNIFCGRKHGIFNTNTSNSVRAAITVVENKENCKGFMLTPLIRFKNEERKFLLKPDVLKNFINERYQIVSKQTPMYCKCFKQLDNIWNIWKEKSKSFLGKYISQYGQYVLSMPNTCRYFTTASKGLMNRHGQIILKFNDENIFNFVFCFINSSFTYWYWRLFDGGITYPRGLLLSMPMFFELLTKEDRDFFNDMANEMIKNASNFKVTKINVGVQENIKYPREFRDKINRKLLDILGLDIDEKIFDLVHSNMALEVNV